VGDSIRGQVQPTTPLCLSQRIARYRNLKGSGKNGSVNILGSGRVQSDSLSAVVRDISRWSSWGLGRGNGRRALNNTRQQQEQPRQQRAPQKDSDSNTVPAHLFDLLPSRSAQSPPPWNGVAVGVGVGVSVGVALESGVLVGVIGVGVLVGVIGVGVLVGPSGVGVIGVLVGVTGVGMSVAVGLGSGSGVGVAS